MLMCQFLPHKVPPIRINKVIRKVIYLETAVAHEGYIGHYVIFSFKVSILKVLSSVVLLLIAFWGLKELLSQFYLNEVCKFCTNVSVVIDG